MRFLFYYFLLFAAYFFLPSHYLVIPEIFKRYFFYKRERHALFLRCLLLEVCLFQTTSLFYFFVEFPYFLYVSFLIQRNCFSNSTIRNRCFYNGSGRAVFCLFRLSRVSFKKFASVGGINGLAKSSW